MERLAGSARTRLSARRRSQAMFSAVLSLRVSARSSARADIEQPVLIVLDGPVRTDDAQGLGRIEHAGERIVAGLRGFALADPRHGIDAGHCGKAVELVALAPCLGHRRHPSAPLFVTAVRRLDRDRRPRRIGRGQQGLDVAMQRPTVSLDRQRVIATAVARLPCRASAVTVLAVRSSRAMISRAAVTSLRSGARFSPSTRRCSAAQAVTRCKGLGMLGGVDPARNDLPSRATPCPAVPIWPERVAAKRLMKARNAASNGSGSGRRQTRLDVSWLGTPRSSASSGEAAGVGGFPAGETPPALRASLPKHGEGGGPSAPRYAPR
jgi:hypothetical protein